MFKKGDLVEVIDLEEYSIDMGVFIGMIAEVIEYDGCFVKVKFNDDTAIGEKTIILYAEELKLIRNR